METAEMGRVVTEAILENNGDLWNAELGLLSKEQVRRVVIPNALVDTGATTLSLPTRVIQQLGLKRLSSRKVLCSVGPHEAGQYSSVRLTIGGRHCAVDVMEVPDTVPALIGQVPLELLDYVVDPCNRRLIGNPAHGGEHVYEQY